jgi:hypothetical protein
VTGELLRCIPCRDGNHKWCTNLIETGRQIPDDDPYRDATRMIPEYIECRCVCRVGVDVA